MKVEGGLITSSLAAITAKRCSTREINPGVIESESGLADTTDFNRVVLQFQPKKRRVVSFLSLNSASRTHEAELREKRRWEVCLSS